MKFSCISLVLATVLSSSSCAAFTPSKSPLLTPVATKIQSTLVEDITTMSPQSPQQITEEQQLNNYVDQEETANQKSFLDDGFVFGLDGSGLDRPKGKGANVVVESDSLETTPAQVAAVSATFAGHALFAANAINHLFAQTDGNIQLTAFTAISTIVASWVAADFGSGVLHWSVDNYGNGRTPVMGNIIAAFQGHHSAPWTITYRGFCNNVFKLCVPFGVPTVGAITLLAGQQHPMVSLFFTVFCACEILSQEFHKWSHMTKKEVPAYVNTLQDLGISIGRVPHAKHHIAPYDGNYCIVSGLCNDLLDKNGAFRFLEHQVYKINGVEANSWKLDPVLRERTLAGEYPLPEKILRQ